MSTDQPSLQIVHESESQRQHIRLSLNASVELEGLSYPVKDISASGLALKEVPKGKGTGLAKEKALDANLSFYLEGGVI